MFELQTQGTGGGSGSSFMVRLEGDMIKYTKNILQWEYRLHPPLNKVLQWSPMGCSYLQDVRLAMPSTRTYFINHRTNSFFDRIGLAAPTLPVSC